VEALLDVGNGLTGVGISDAGDNDNVDLGLLEELLEVEVGLNAIDVLRSPVELSLETGEVTVTTLEEGESV
jgi:hypothetical protein